MTEVEYVITNFPKRLANFKNKRIVLHGSRNYAEAIIEKYAETFNFIGIMSLDSIDGTSFHGLSALLTMLNSCAEGMTVVNIDNGFVVGYTANLINRKIMLAARKDL